jgi:hypothetical protein
MIIPVVTKNPPTHYKQHFKLKTPNLKVITGVSPFLDPRKQKQTTISNNQLYDPEILP